MKYLTFGEMIRIAHTVNFLNEALKIDDAADPIGMEVDCYDINGEAVGKIEFREAQYVFIPFQDEEEA